MTGTLVGERTVQEGGDLVMALSAEPDRLDPTTSSSLYTRYVMQTMCQKLYDIDAQGEIVPQLATALPDISDDGLTVEIPIRTDARFADGAPLDAEAVRTTLDRHLELPDSARAGELGPIEDVEAIGPDRVRITYDQPFAPLTAALADRAGMILSPQALAEYGDDFGGHPVCVGPFRFVERVPQTSITVERDPHYYAADDVHLDTITYRIISDANLRAANLRSGDVQVADTISPQDADALLREDGIEMLQVGSLGYQGLTINIGNTGGIGAATGQVDTVLARHPEARQALAMSINRELLVGSVFNSWYDPACSPISPASPFSTPESERCGKYDPEGARELLEEAGIQTPVQIDMQVSNTPDAQRLAQALQASVSEAGFTLNIIPVEYSTLLDIQTRGDFELLQLGWSGRIDPHGNMFNFLSTGQSNNYSGYNSDVVDGLLSRAASTVDPEERSTLYGRAVEQVQQDNPLIYLYRLRSLTAHTDEVTGVAAYPDGVVRLDATAFLAPEEVE